MNVNCYLPDELGERAKDAGIPLSALLKDTVERELARREVEPGSKIAGLEGAYVRGQPGKGLSVVLHLNAVSDARGSGINLMPAGRIDEPESGTRSIVLTEAAVRKLADAIEDRAR